MLDDEDIAWRYRRAPAAKQIHHAFLGGLIEHVLSVCALARVAAAALPEHRSDLLLTGVVLHDIGKIYELNYERGFSYSNDGQLIGHISIAMRMVAEKLRGLPDFPPQLRTLVEHMILSHHGQLTSVRPSCRMFPEALMLHYLDDLDSKMECMRGLLEKEGPFTGVWTGYSAPLDRSILNKRKFLAPEASEQPAVPAVAGERPAGQNAPSGSAQPTEKPTGQPNRAPTSQHVPAPQQTTPSAKSKPADRPATGNSLMASEASGSTAPGRLIPLFLKEQLQRLFATISATYSPMASDAVAAGLGAFTTWSSRSDLLETEILHQRAIGRHRLRANPRAAGRQILRSDFGNQALQRGAK